MPEGDRKIDYHLMTNGHIASACQVPEFVGSLTPAACEIPGTRQIAAAYLPQQHELIHAYMDLLSTGALPIPMVVEGTAESIGCGTGYGTDLTHKVPWQQAMLEVASDPTGNVYVEGGLLARYLIRTEGIDAWVRYYRQAPERRDPALFADNFFAFWNMTVDDVWAAMHIVKPGAASTDRRICPCSLPALPEGGDPVPVGAPYWTMGDTGGTSLAVTAPGLFNIDLEDCEGVTPAIVTAGAGLAPGAPAVADANLAIIGLPDDRRRYLLAPLTTASTGHYLSDDCAGTTPYPLPADFLSGGGKVWILAAPGAAGLVTKYVQLQIPFAAQVTPAAGVAICNDCGFDQGACSAPSTPADVDSPSTVAPGPLNVQVSLFPIPQATKVYLLGSALQFEK